MLKIKKNYFFYSFSPFLSLFLSFLILQARNQHIWLEKRTLRLNLPYGHLGRQPLKPLGSEVTHPPWPPSVHITNHHYHLHITLFYTTQDISQPTQQHTTYNISHTTIQLHTSTTHMLNHMVMQVSCRLMQIPCRLSCSHMYSLPLSLLYVAVHQSPDPWSELFSFYDLTFWQAV